MELNYWEAAAAPAPPQVFDESDMMMSCIHDEQNNLEAELLLVGSHFLQSLHNNKSNDDVDNHFNEFNPHILLDPFYVTSCHTSDTTSLLNVENPTSFGHHLHPYPSDINFQPLEVVVDDGNSNARKASVENVVGNKRGVEGEMRSVTPQSIAARKRRRKITEKTQELGRLVPGGSKMNTAEMLTAAFNYVKFLQAQIGILRFMHSFHQEEVKAAKDTKLLQLAASPVIQEKLYMEQKCLIPKEFVEVLATYLEAQSKPSLSHNLDQLLKSSG